MAVTVTHATVATGTDAGNGEIRKAQWNEAHTVTNAADITAVNTFTSAQIVPNLKISEAAATNRNLEYRTSGTLRWVAAASSTSESGSNAGTDYELYRYSDAGSFLSTALSISRATGLTTLEALNVTGALRTNSKYVPYIFAQSGAATSVGAVTTETTLATISFAGGELGANGWIQVITHWSVNNNANAKNLRVRVGGGAGTIFYDYTAASVTGNARPTFIINANSASSQKSGVPTGNTTGFGQFTSAGPTAAVNTASAWDLAITGQKANSADTLTLEGYQVMVCYGA